MKYLKHFEAKEKEEKLFKYYGDDPDSEIRTIDRNKVKITKDFLDRIKKSLNRCIGKSEGISFIISFNGPYEIQFFIFHALYDSIDDVYFNKRALMKFRLKMYLDNWFIFQKVSLSERFVGRRYMIDGWDGLLQKFKHEIKLAKKELNKLNKFNDK